MDSITQFRGAFKIQIFCGVAHLLGQFFNITTQCFCIHNPIRRINKFAFFIGLFVFIANFGKYGLGHGFRRDIVGKTISRRFFEYKRRLLPYINRHRKRLRKVQGLPATDRVKCVLFVPVPMCWGAGGLSLYRGNKSSVRRPSDSVRCMH